MTHKRVVRISRNAATTFRAALPETVPNSVCHFKGSLHSSTARLINTQGMRRASNFRTWFDPNRPDHSSSWRMDTKARGDKGADKADDPVLCFFQRHACQPDLQGSDIELTSRWFPVVKVR